MEKKLNDEINVLSEDILILIVDDQIENLQILGNILNINNYKKAVATNGQEALEIARKRHPDLILLDIMMPGMDGYEVCRHLKEDNDTVDIPIVFLTAKSQTEDIVKGFRFGGLDYITKPFNHEELLARIRTHIELKKSKDLILEKNLKLKDLNRERVELMSIAAHDLKNPLQVMVGFSKLIEDKSEKFSTDELKEFARDIRESGEAMFKIITDLLDINAAEEGNIVLDKEWFSLEDIIKRVIEYMNIKAVEKNIEIIYTNNSENIDIESDPGKVKQILDNLISNAIKFSQFDRKVYISTSSLTNGGPEMVRVEIKDEGPGLTDEDKEKLFVKFAKLSAQPTNNESSTRLGLSIVKTLVEMLGGVVWCESEPGEGAIFIFDLPVNSRY